jgi:hypothetical protein
MNSSLIKTEYLATGQAAPFTGDWVNTALCKEGLVVIYASGSSVNINLQGKTELNQAPIFLNGGSASAVSFYTATGIGAGYGAPIFFDSPFANIRLAVTAGSAPVFAYITYQN